MSNQIKFNDNILDEAIPIYLDSISTKERLESDILRLQGELEELETNNTRTTMEKDELDEKINKKQKEENIIKTKPRLILLKTYLTNFIFYVLCLSAFPIFAEILSISIRPILFGLFISGSMSVISIALCLFFKNPITSFYLKYSYKHNSKYRELKDSLTKDIEKQSELQASIDNINATIEDKESEIDNKRRELEKLSPAIESMERKIGRKLILERAVIFSVPSEVLDTIRNIDDILEPNQELPTEEGKKPYTLTTPTTT